MAAEPLRAKTIEGIGLLVGMIIGAGLFALPYSFAKAGVGWGLVLFIAILGISFLLHYLYAAIIYATPGKHRFTGYMRRYLGHAAELVALCFTFFGYYGSMLAYGVLGAVFLGNIFGFEFYLAGLWFFILGGALFFLSLKLVGKINFYLTLPLLAFILVLAAKLLPSLNTGNFSAPTEPAWFLPYGILLFAFAGYSSLPDLHDVLGGNSRALSRRIIFWSLLLSAVFYLIFIFSVVGATGLATTEDALSGLSDKIGSFAVVVGSLIGLLAVFTSYIVFGADLKLTFRYDYNLSEVLAWLLAFLPPVLLFASGFTNFVEILSVVGSVGLGVFAVFTVAVAWKEREKLESFLGFRPQGWWLFLLGALIFIGALSDLFSLL